MPSTFALERIGKQGTKNGKILENQSRGKAIGSSFFLVTMPKEEKNDEVAVAKKEAYAKLLYDMAEFFDNTYVIDLYQYGPVYDEDFRKMFYYNNHMNPCGYELTAKMFMSYIDYLIRHNMDEFQLAGMIGHGMDLKKYRK